MTIQEIKSYMKNNGITQIELSKRSGIPLGSLRNIFSGRVPSPKIDTINAICEALNINFKIPEPGEYEIRNYRTGIKDRIVIYDHSGDTYEFNFLGEDFEHILKVCEALTADYKKLDYIKRK